MHLCCNKPCVLFRGDFLQCGSVASFSTEYQVQMLSGEKKIPSISWQNACGMGCGNGCNHNCLCLYYRQFQEIVHNQVHLS